VSTRIRIVSAGFVQAILLAALFVASSARAQSLRGEEIVRYLQPGRWEIEIIPDLSRMTEAQRKRLESHGGAHRTLRSTDCLDAHGKSEMMAGLEDSNVTKEAERRAERDCKTKLTPLGPHEARIVTSCNINGRITEIIATCRYTTLEVARRTADGHEAVFKKAHRIGECK
jgi:hypothetical protein